jgi:hypothetical protein
MPPASGAASPLLRNLAAARKLPSGDHDSWPVAGKSSSRRSALPRAEARWIARGRLQWPRRNAIRAPSGDQAGSVSSLGSVIRGRASASPTTMSQMSASPPLTPGPANAIWLPSGEKLPSAPPVQLSWTTRGVGCSRCRWCHSTPAAAPTTARMAAATPALQRRLLLRVAAAPAGASACESDSSFTSWSSIFASSMFWKRRSGSFLRHRRTIRSSSFGTSGASSLGGFGCSFRTAPSVSALDVPLNARWPVTIS